jgi:hypothetical protein
MDTFFMTEKLTIQGYKNDQKTNDLYLYFWYDDSEEPRATLRISTGNEDVNYDYVSLTIHKTDLFDKMEITIDPKQDNLLDYFENLNMILKPLGFIFSILNIDRLCGIGNEFNSFYSVKDYFLNLATLENRVSE